MLDVLNVGDICVCFWLICIRVVVCRPINITGQVNPVKSIKANQHYYGSKSCKITTMGPDRPMPWPRAVSSSKSEKHPDMGGTSEYMIFG